MGKGDLSAEWKRNMIGREGGFINIMQIIIMQGSKILKRSDTAFGFRIRRIFKHMA